MTDLGECGALRNLFDTVYERAEIPRSNLRVSHELHEVVNDDHRAPLNLHAPVVQCSRKQRDKDRESRRSHLGNKCRR